MTSSFQSVSKDVDDVPSIMNTVTQSETRNHKLYEKLYIHFKRLCNRHGIVNFKDVMAD